MNPNVHTFVVKGRFKEKETLEKINKQRLSALLAGLKILLVKSVGSYGGFGYLWCQSVKATFFENYPTQSITIS